MLPLALTRVVSRWLPDLVSGQVLHRQALAASATGDASSAVKWFEVAASQYRRELAVEPLARLRVHQQMVRAGAVGGRGVDSNAMLEIVRGLNRLDQLESLEAPFELGDARAVLAAWIERSEGASKPSAPTLQPSATLVASAEGDLPAAQAA